jgi:hypothetical protein
MKNKFSYIFFVLIPCLFLNAQTDIKVLYSNSNSITFEYTPEYFISDVNINGSNFKNIELKNGLTDSNLPQNSPIIYKRFVNVAVPSEFGNTIQVQQYSSEIIKGKILVNKESFNNSNSFINYNNELVSFGKFGNIRGLLVQSFILSPIEYDSENEEIKLYKKIIFSINFAGENKVSFLADNNLQDIVLNYNQALQWNKTTSQKFKTTGSSPLATGKWVKIEIKEEGIYKIDRNTLTNLGFDVNSLDPRKIKIYNNGGYLLNEDPDSPRSNNLIENAIYVFGEEDGKFDNSDYILFYGRGVDFWEYNKTYKKILRNRHYYSKSNYYFITAEGTIGKRMGTTGVAGQNGNYSQTVSKAYAFYEEDKINLLKSGRMSFGDEFNATNNSKTYLTSLVNRVEGTPVNYKFQVVNFSTNSVSFKVTETNTTIYNNILRGATGWYSDGELHTISATSNNPNLSENRSQLNLNFAINNSTQKAYLDFIEIEYQRYLKSANDEILFFSKDTTTSINYRVSNFSNSDIFVFDVTDFSNIKKINVNISAGDVLFTKDEVNGNVSKYIALCSSKFKAVTKFENVANSDILNDNSGGEYLIISSNKFKSIAEKYLNYRKYSAPYPITSKLVYVEDIFTQLNSGILDPTAIRDYIKYAYDNWNIKPFYVLLLGDGDYDYHNFEGYSANFVPTYQTELSLNEVFSYPTDDYYGRIVGGKTDLAIDVSIGRLPIRSVAQGELILDKIVKYENNNDKNLWKNLITLVADDGLTSSGDDGSIHTSQSERLARDFIPQYFDLNKIYLSAYPTVITGLGRRKPAVTEAIVNAVNNGTLILNYIGHGNPDVWAHEYVFERTSTIPLFRNEQQFFLTAATCDFGKYDDPVTQSATEEMIFMQNAGMIGGFSACRPVVSGENAALNNLFYSYLFSLNNGLVNTVGRAYWQTKQTRFQANDEKFHLFCDPYLRLAQPSKQVKIDSINGNSSTLLVDLKALGKGNVVGTVIDSLGNIDENFNGEGILTVFDSEKSLYLSDIQFNMTLQGGVIFRGRVSVQNGRFSSNFIVPKDISYENKNGKIVVYVYSNENDGVGFTKNVKINGTDTTVVNDNKGPEIEIFADDLNYENAKLVKPDFNLLVKLFDETGLNTTGTGLGHKLEGIINDNVNNSVDFSNYFLGDLDSGGKSGIIKYRFTNLNEGDFKIKIKAWDVFNNFNEQETFFYVVKGDDLVITDLVNYPNPFAESTTFTFQHNLNEPINIKIKVYTIAGRLIKEIEEKFINDRFVKVYWNGKDEDNNTLANGTYLYKAIIETTDGRLKKNILGKLAIIK